MDDPVTTQSAETPAEAALRSDLAQSDAVLGKIGTVLGHLLANQDHSLFSDEIISRVRSMVEDVARQMLTAQATASESSDPRAWAERNIAPLTASLLAEEQLVAHCHVLALEWQLTCRLEARSAIDPVLSPLLQALVASDDASTASSAMAALTAQARFVQRQRRMELPLEELPADHYHRALAVWLERAQPDEAAVRAAAMLRERYDESATRLGLLDRLVHTMGAAALAALSVSHGGVAIFLSALAQASQQTRDIAVIATSDRQLARFALSLRAGGLEPRAIEEQFFYIHPDVPLPEGWGTLRADRARALLAAFARTSLA